MTERYKIVRFYQNRQKQTVRGMTGLTLEQAQAHCSDPETSSRTAQSERAKARTRKFGPWFEGYTRES